MPRWTNEQLEAINNSGQNIVVSAGAGSGKTAVLTERVITKLKSGININELLILTFTNAAAKEMKTRIRKALKEDLSLKEQLDLIDGAFITTFDSFALSIVKKYHYLFNISSNVSIADSTIINLEKEKILDSIFEDLYKKKDPLFVKMINDLCIKDDKTLRAYILNVDDKLNLKIDKIKYLDNYKNYYFSDEFIDENINKYVFLIKNKIADVKDILDEISYLVDGDYFSSLEKCFELLFNSNTYEDIKNNLNIKLPNLPKNSGDDVTNLKKFLKKELDDLQILCSYCDLSEIKNKISLSYDYVTIICYIIKELESRITAFKYEKELFEFNDIIKMSIKVIENNKNVKEEVKKSFKEIMVDEYQDTSDLQEYFINLIEDNNVYMVGDIKQSIYRFRNANPDIFKNKYERYSKNDGGMKIDLNANFRSRKEVVGGINLIFDYIMDRFIGGADYKLSHEMIFGNKSYEEHKPNQNYDTSILMYKYDSKGKYSKQEIEYFKIVTDIKEKIEKGILIYDKDLKDYRPCLYSDFCILVDRGTTFGLAKKIFEYMHVPLTICKDDVITSSIVVTIMRNLIKLIIKERNKEYDTNYEYLFMSIARSFLFEYSDEKLFKLIKDHDISNDKVITKIKSLIKNIENISLSNFIYNIYKEFNIYENLIKIGNVSENYIILEYIYNISRDLEDAGYSIELFSNYLEDITTKDYDIKIKAIKSDSNSVKIMTIHTSKGLEFPVCYFAGLDTEFNLKEIKDRIVYSDNYGIIAPYFENGIGKTIYMNLLKEDYILSEVSEKIRLFYVALTRAKEKMIFLLPINEKNKFNSFSLNVRRKYRSFSDILYSILSYLDKYISYINLDEINLTKDYNMFKKKELVFENCDKKIEFKTYYSNSNIVGEKKFSKDLNVIMDNELRSNLDFGLLFHECLEYIDFKNPNYDMIENSFVRNKVKKFLESDKLKNIGNSKIYKESEFMYDDLDSSYHGIVDLIIEYDDYIDVIDYKLKYVVDDNYTKQLNGYKKYLSNVCDKKINLYLYSILDEEFKKIDI